MAVRKSISKRPSIAAEKVEIGHWEGDTVESKRHRGGIATFVDIKTKYTVIRKVKDKSSEKMKNAILGSFIGCPELIKTLTVDNGNEFALHSEISKELKDIGKNIKDSTKDLTEDVRKFKDDIQG